MDDRNHIPRRLVHLQTAEALAQCVHEVANKIRSSCWIDLLQTRDGTKPRVLHIVAVLDGACMFAADLARELPEARLHFVACKSYVGTKPGDALQWTKWLDEPHALTGQPVVIVDDIVESGRTMNAVADRVRRCGPSEVFTCALLHKPGHGGQRPDFVGLDVGTDEFVVGYGLDHDGAYRCLPYLAKLI